MQQSPARTDRKSNYPATYGIGDAAPRPEDRRLVTGRGAFTDDVALPGQAWAVLARATVAHGEIRGIDVEAARRMPGVLAVFTGRDLVEAGSKGLACRLPLRNRDGSPLRAPIRPLLAVDRVRFVGEGVAFVVAETWAQARDAAESVALDLDPLPASVALDRAADAARLHDDVPDNTALLWRQGDADAVEAAFAGAAHVTRIALVNNRVAASPLEPRAAVASFDAGTEHFTLHVGCQGVYGMRNGVADALGVPADRVRVLSGDVGGSFGSKGAPYPEYALALHAARALGRPVKWRDDRSDSFVSDNHGRASRIEAELALDRDGRFLAMRVRQIADMGAWLTPMSPHIQTVNIVKNVPGPYATPLLQVDVACVFTNTTPIGPYRGAGRPEGNYIRERLIDAAARETGIDPVALRRRNLIAADQLPYTAASGLSYDSGDFEPLLDRTLELADWNGFEARRAASAGRGKLRGRGLSLYLEVTAPVGKEMGGLRFGADGRVSVITGTKNHGQGHEATFAQIVASKLGVPFDKIDLVQGDSSQLLNGGGSGGSRSTMASGTALNEAADQVIEKGRAVAGHILEASSADIEFAGGIFRIVGTDRAVGLAEVVARARSGELPESLPQSLDSALVVDTPPSAFPNGGHVCEVEIDPETGVAAVVRYAVVDDFGTLVNPMIVEGQVHGGVAQGVGQALLETVVYGADGQLLTGSFLDYGMPRANDVPPLSLAFRPVPARTNALGAKGCGEAGVTGALPAIMNAITDALARAGAAPVDMPATPERLWRALAAAAGRNRRP